MKKWQSDIKSLPCELSSKKYWSETNPEDLNQNFLTRGLTFYG